MPRLVSVLGLVLLIGCAKGKTENLPPGVELRQVRSGEVEIVPSVTDLGYCLVFSVAASGDLRQLTSNLEDTSFRCEPGKPIGGGPFRVATDEGRTRFLVLFSDQALSAASVAEQLYDLDGKPRVSALDLSLPGRVRVEIVELAADRAL